MRQIIVIAAALAVTACSAEGPQTRLLCLRPAHLLAAQENNRNFERTVADGCVHRS